MSHLFQYNLPLNINKNNFNLSDDDIDEHDQIDYTQTKHKEASIRTNGQPNPLALESASASLPGLIILNMYQQNRQFSEEEIYSFVLPKFEDLRKTDGSRYKVFIQFWLIIREMFEGLLEQLWPQVVFLQK